MKTLQKVLRIFSLLSSSVRLVRSWVNLCVWDWVLRNYDYFFQHNFLKVLWVAAIFQCVDSNSSIGAIDFPANCHIFKCNDRTYLAVRWRFRINATNLVANRKVCRRLWTISVLTEAVFKCEVADCSLRCVRLCPCRKNSFVYFWFKFFE